MCRNIEIYGDFKLCPILCARLSNNMRNMLVYLKLFIFYKEAKGGGGSGGGEVDWDGDICFTNH